MREKESEEFEKQLNKSIGYNVHWDEQKIANQRGEKENQVAVVQKYFFQDTKRQTLRAKCKLIQFLRH